MRSSFVCVGIAIALLAAACNKQEKVTTPLLPVPQCKAAQAYDAAAFERMVRAMDRSGDIAEVTQRFVQHRKLVEGLLNKRDPNLLPRLKPVLDAQFSEARLRDRAACVFVDLAGQGEGVKALGAWSRAPEMQAINRAIWTHTPATSEDEAIKMTPERMALMRDIAAAMALQQVEVNNAKVDREGVTALVAVFGPAPPPVAEPLIEPTPAVIPAPTAGVAPTATSATAAALVNAAQAPSTAPMPSASAPAPATPAPNAALTEDPPSAPGATPASNASNAAPAPIAASIAAPMPAAAPAPQVASGPIAVPELDDVVERWLIPVLGKIPDDDLSDYLAFAGSSFGGDYYVALSRSHDFQTGEWYAQTLKLFTDNIPPAAAVAGGPDRNALLADARHSLRDITTAPAAVDAMAKLLQADRLDPRNPEIQMLLGEAAMKSAPAMPLGPDQLRSVIETPNYLQAEKYFSKAIELAPGLADAHMLMGRLRYLQGRDDEAAKLYASGAELEPEHPSKDLYLGDLAFVQNDYGKATRYYKSAVAKPERLAYTHVTALAHLLITLRKGTQASEYPSIAQAYLAKYPQAWNFRLDYADYLLSVDTRSDKILGVADPIPDTWLPARKVPIMSAALIRKAGERVDRAGIPREDSLQYIKRAIAMNPDAGTLAEAVCRAGATHKLARGVFDASQDQKRLATALTVCGLRWQRHEIAREMSTRADIAQLSLPRPDLGGDTPLCYAAATKNLEGFGALVEAQVSPARKCRDGNTVAERLLQMSFGRDPNVAQMQIIMKRFYKKS
jgi:tetratricopeptide (TPR) repeat protein